MSWVREMNSYNVDYGPEKLSNKTHESYNLSRLIEVSLQMVPKPKILTSIDT